MFVEPKTKLMELIKNTELPQMEYPVHKHLLYNEGIIMNMAELILENCPKDKGIALLCSGTSGIIVATYIFQFLTKKIKSRIHICYIRKGEENRHEDCKVSAPMFLEDYFNIIVDDFMASGKTINEIYASVEGRTLNESIKIDLLCLSGEVLTRRLHFEPKMIIAQNFDGVTK